MRIRIRRVIAALLVALLTVNLVGAGAAAADTGRASDTQFSSSEETVYINTYGGEVRSTAFNDHWRFYDGDAGTTATALNYDDSGWQDVSLPHDYSIEKDFTSAGEAESGFLPGGVGWYRKTFTLAPEWQGKVLSIDFDGAYMTTQVWLNGHKLGDNNYGYNPFSFVLPDNLLNKDGENVIAVRTDNPVPTSRWYSGSGIYREVTLTATDPVHVSRYGAVVTTPELEKQGADQGKTHVVLTVQNDGKQAADITVQYSIFEKGGKSAVATGSSESTRIQGGEKTELEIDLTVQNPRLWTLDAPQLYTLRAEVSAGGKVVDTYETDFGFRWFGFDLNKGFSLNGEQMKLQGVCMHHDQGALGAEAWRRATERQVQLLKEMGCNAIRVTHNPASEALIQICNEKGMLVIEEMFDGWHQHKNSNSNDFATYFAQQVGSEGPQGSTSTMQWSQFTMREVMRRDVNAPSIIAWSLGNEVQEGTPTNSLDSTYVTWVNTLIGWAQEIDQTRPLTTGDNRRGESPYSIAISQALSDAGGIVGYNYGTSNSFIATGHSNGWKMYASETASAVNSRGVYDYKGTGGQTDDQKLTSYDKSRVNWGAVASDAWWRVLQQDFCAGEFVWTGFDYIGEPTPWNKTNSGWTAGADSPKNSYFGIIDTAGFPKDSYYLYQALWNDKVTTLHVLPTWDEDDVLIDSSGNVEVVVYSDAPVVKLYLDGQEVGTATSTVTTTQEGYTYRTFTEGTGGFQQKTGHQSLYATFNVKWAEGTLTAKAFEENGTTEIKDTEGRATVKTTGGAQKLVLTPDRATITADGRDLSYITVDVTDNDGQIVNGAEHEITVSIQGSGVIVGVDNGVQNDHTRYQSLTRKAGAGKLLVIVQSTDRAGTFTVTARASGLTGGSATVATTRAAGGEARKPVSYTLSRNYYVKVGNRPVLPESVKVQYSDGTEATKEITWDGYDVNHTQQAGSFTVSGVIEGIGTRASVHINMLDEVAVLLNYSCAILTGGKPTLPASRPAILTDGSRSTAEFPVTWKMPDASAFENEGIVEVPGTAQIFGKSFEVKAWVRVAAGSVIEGGNVASSADGLYLNEKGETNTPGLEVLRDGRKDAAWTGSGDVLFSYATAQSLYKIKLAFSGDAETEKDKVTFYWSGDGSTWTEIEGQTTASGSDLTVTLSSLASAVWIKLSFSREARVTEAEFITGTPDFPINSSPDLTGITVNGKDVDAASLKAHEYPTQYLLVKELAVRNGNNAAWTALPEIGGVVRILTESEDHTKNAEYAIVLGQDTNGAPLAADDDSKDYDRNKTTPTALSAQPLSGKEGPVNLATDGDESTFWHTAWGENLENTPQNRYIQLALEEAQLITALRYLPRPNAGNGTVTGYRVEVSTDGQQYREVASGTWDRTTGWKIAEFGPTSARYVRLYGTSTYGDTGTNRFMTAAEVRVRVADSADDPTDLSQAVVTVRGSYQWTGENIIPDPEDVTVTLGSETLEYGVDYRLRCENNLNAGVATVYAEGIVDYTGSASGTFVIAEVEQRVVDYVPLDEVKTLNGEPPQLPETVTAVMDVGPNVTKSVRWDAVDASQYTDPAEKVFTVKGTVEGTDLRPTVTVRVIRAVAAQGVSGVVAAGTEPTLPERVTVYFDDGSTGQMAVQWQEIDPAAFKKASDTPVVLNGTVQAGKDTLPVTASIRPVTGNPTENLAANESGNGFPMALAYVSSGDNNPYQALKSGHSTAGTDRWSDWERNTYHTDPNLPWIAVALSGTAEPTAPAENTTLTVEPRLVNRVDLYFVEEASSNPNHVTYPQDYEVQYYIGPAVLTGVDTRLTAPGAGNNTIGNGVVRALGEEHPLNKAENWKTVTYTGTKPLVVEETGEGITVEFEPVNAGIFRVLCTPKPNMWVGVCGFEVYGIDMSGAAHHDFEVTSIKLDGEEHKDDFDESNYLEVTLEAGDSIPEVTAEATNNAQVTCKQAQSRTDAALVIITPEDGGAAATYTVQFKEADPPVPPPTPTPTPTPEPTPPSGGDPGSGWNGTTQVNPDGSITTTTKRFDGSTVERTTWPDGTVSEKVTRRDGSATVTTRTPNGVTGRTTTGAGGEVLSAEVTVPSQAAGSGTVTAPVELPVAGSSADAPEVSVSVKGSKPARVEIPVTEFGPGTVAVIVQPDGTEKIVRDCVIGENGVVLTVEGDVTLKIVDNTVIFSDVQPVRHWASDAVEFVAARELFNGTGGGKFTPDGNMSRAMLVTVLHRLCYEPEAAASDFSDVDGGAYYADAVAWAEAEEIAQGYGSGSFKPHDDVTREQMVTFLYRYAEKQGYLDGPAGTLAGYADAGSVSGWAKEAMSWAVNNGIIQGVDKTHLAPGSNATRAQVAAILERFCENVVK